MNFIYQLTWERPTISSLDEFSPWGKDRVASFSSASQICLWSQLPNTECLAQCRYLIYVSYKNAQIDG